MTALTQVLAVARSIPISYLVVGAGGAGGGNRGGGGGAGGVLSGSTSITPGSYAVTVGAGGIGVLGAGGDGGSSSFQNIVASGAGGGGSSSSAAGGPGGSGGGAAYTSGAAGGSGGQGNAGGSNSFTNGSKYSIGQGTLLQLERRVHRSKNRYPKSHGTSSQHSSRATKPRSTRLRASWPRERGTCLIWARSRLAYRRPKKDSTAPITTISPIR